MKEYRLDLKRWETRVVFNKTQVWFKYELFQQPTEWSKGKKARGRAKYFDMDKVPKISAAEVQRIWDKIWPDSKPS